LKSRILISLAVIAVAALIFVGLITRDGEWVVPKGDGIVALDAGDFEAFPLPDYASKFLTEGYKSYFVEVEPGIKVHVLEVGSGFPLYLQHGNPTSGFLYRKVAEALPTDRVRVIMPTLVGLGFSSKVPASEHTLDNHIRWIHGVLEQLKLTELVYAGQDWGGPVGMGALARSPDLLKGVVVLNTFSTLRMKRETFPVAMPSPRGQSLVNSYLGCLARSSRTCLVTRATPILFRPTCWTCTAGREKKAAMTKRRWR
jgi:haloalkane dehalogenase